MTFYYTDEILSRWLKVIADHQETLIDFLTATTSGGKKKKVVTEKI